MDSIAKIGRQVYDEKKHEHVIYIYPEYCLRERPGGMNVPNPEALRVQGSQVALDLLFRAAVQRPPAALRIQLATERALPVEQRQEVVVRAARHVDQMDHAGARLSPLYPWR